MKKSIKEKVSEKVSAAKGKIAKKCGKSSKTIAAMFAFACCCVLTGCTTADAPTAQRAQTNTAKDVSFVFNVNASSTNATPATVNISVEVATAAQANETAGAESMTSTATQTPTTAVKPQTTLTYGLCSGSSSGTSWIEDLTNASAKGLATWLKSGTANGNMTVTKKDGSTETVTCKDGTCTTASGDCINCTP